MDVSKIKPKNKPEEKKKINAFTFLDEYVNSMDSYVKNPTEEKIKKILDDMEKYESLINKHIKIPITLKNYIIKTFVKIGNLRKTIIDLNKSNEMYEENQDVPEKDKIIKEQYRPLVFELGNLQKDVKELISNKKINEQIVKYLFNLANAKILSQ